MKELMVECELFIIKTVWMWRLTVVCMKPPSLWEPLVERAFHEGQGFIFYDEEGAVMTEWPLAL